MSLMSVFDYRTWKRFFSKKEKFGGWEEKVTEKVLRDTGREEYIEQAKTYNYAELPQFEGKESDDGFWCYNCEYFRPDEDSPTGYWCVAINIPDRPHGCCALHDLKPHLRKNAD